jgi:hypothetical protein
MSPITLWEEPGFTGRSVVLDVGQVRFFTPADFNDTASSIQVPPGLVVFLYEHADDLGGYGRAVDVMEDCPDLSVYGFAKAVSYVTVFTAVNERGLIWVRGRGSGDAFVPGHWERRRADGQDPSNAPPAAVSPSIPSRMPPPKTALEVRGTTTTITTLGPQEFAAAGTWQHAVNDQMDVIGSDYRGAQEIGTASVERASNNPVIPDWLNFWFPQLPPRDHRPPHKRTLVGTLREVHVADIPGTFEDHDVNIDVVPDPLYEYLITDGHRREYTDIMSAQWNLSAHSSGQPDCDDTKSVESFAFVEGEIQPSSDLGSGVAEGLRDRIAAAGGRVGMYGPWIYDKGHCCHSEIHPAEQIWWREDGAGGEATYHLNVICDASKRYWWRDQMADGTKLKPWGAPPVTGVFAVAFAVDPPDPARPGAGPLTFSATLESGHNVSSVVDGGGTHRLEYQGRTLVRFEPGGDAFAASFEQVGTGDDGRIRGFLVLETTVGVLRQKRITRQYPPGTDVDTIPQDDERKIFRKEEGHHMFSLRRHVEAPVATG